MSELLDDTVEQHRQQAAQMIELQQYQDAIDVCSEALDLLQRQPSSGQRRSELTAGFLVQRAGL